MSSSKPYYSVITKYSISNKEKALLGEQAFAEALSGYPVFINIAFGKRQKDIDHLVLTSKSVVMNECKNTKESFRIFYSWFLSHVVDRFADGLPIAQYYARALGYPIRNIIFTLTIPYLNTDMIVKKALKGLRIRVIQTEEQLLKERNKKHWYAPVRKQFLSVINNQANNYRDKIVDDEESHFLCSQSFMVNCICDLARKFLRS
ncbi:MAG: NERD domain-containing protein [Candidatus Bathyarchaeota archaeon]|nr:NERD domain-containing protein [Candidatus Bathyarchaeota archaeon]MDH5744586.1 NERD domain-containing protein [Candidatus Aminicenantes bacterium]